MSNPVLTASPALDPAAVGATVARDGIAGLPAAFAPEWVTRLRADFDAADADARALPGGTVGRGPNRYYFSLPPERLSGFVDLVTHPWVTALSERILGPDWAVAEIGFDVPLPGALDQPWHRDFRMPEETRADGRLTSLAFNITTVTVTPDMGPLEIVPGTHREPGDGFEHGMFPPADTCGAYAAAAVRKLPRLGDASVRTGLTIHRGTRNHSALSRPVLILGTVAPGTDTAVHRLVLSRSYAAGLPAAVRDRLIGVELVDEVGPLIQRHDIEGLRMGG
jgi:hypothetical protein